MGAPDELGERMLPVHEIDLGRDSRWPAFLKRHPETSIFHTPEWLQAFTRRHLPDTR